MTDAELSAWLHEHLFGQRVAYCEEGQRHYWCFLSSNDVLYPPSGRWCELAGKPAMIDGELVYAIPDYCHTDWRLVAETMRLRGWEVSVHYFSANVLNASVHGYPNWCQMKRMDDSGVCVAATNGGHMTSRGRAVCEAAKAAVEWEEAQAK